MAHEIYAPSSSATWLECTYSARHSVPEQPKPEGTRLAAEAGTRDHDTMEGVVSGEDYSEEDFALLAMSFINQLESGSRFTELKVELAPDCGGTADLFNNNSQIATVLDYKFGKWDVDAYHNKQMLTYAAGLLNVCEAPWWRLVIFQPNGLDETPFKQWVAHRSEVEAHRDRVLRAIADRSPPRPGPWCRWCNAFQQCPAMSTDAGFMMGAISRAPETLTTEELVRLLRIVRALGDVKPVYEDALTTHLKMGRTTAGAALKPQRAWRAWNDAQQAASFLHQNFGFKGVKPVTPAQAEKLGLAGKQYASIGAHKPEAPLKATY